MIQLLCEDGRLHTPRSVLSDPVLLQTFSGNPIILHLNDEGDCDTIKWPDYSADNLRAALYGDRETGVLPSDTKSVLLPDGAVFDID